MQLLLVWVDACLVLDQYLPTSTGTLQLMTNDFNCSRWEFEVSLVYNMSTTLGDGLVVRDVIYILPLQNSVCVMLL